MMPTLNVPLDNTLTGGCYTASVLVGGGRLPTKLIVDTGSSSLVVEGRLYAGADDADRKTTNLAQAVSYGAGWWAGSVLRTSIAIRGRSSHFMLPNANVAVTRQESAHGFGGADGILGLAYQALDAAYDMGMPTWPDLDVSKFDGAGRTQIEPYFMQLEKAGLCSNVFSLLTRRSRMRFGPDPSKDPANQGLLVLGGGEERTDLYDGPIQDVRVTHDVYFNMNLKGLRLGDGPMISVPSEGPKGASNSFLDSGLPAILLPTDLYRQLINQFGALNSQYSEAITTAGTAGSAALDESLTWPDITLVLDGMAGDVTLAVSPTTYWQAHGAENGESVFAIETADDVDQVILGLPLMNNYFCIFDRSANDGQGIIRFAPLR